TGPGRGSVGSVVLRRARDQGGGAVPPAGDPVTLPVGYPPLPEPLPAPVIDSHCHLDIGVTGRDGEPGLDIETALAAAEAVGIDAVIQVGVDVSSSEEAVRLAHAWPQVAAAVALHPNEAPR